MTTIKLSTYPKLCDRYPKTLTVGGEVVIVEAAPCGAVSGADLKYERFTKNYTTKRDRPYIVCKTGTGYKTLEAACVAFLKHEKA